MSLNVRVEIPAIGSTKTVRFSESTIVSDALTQIQDKANGLGGADFGLFLADPNPEKNKTMGRWMKNDKSMEFYSVKTGDTLIYKSRKERLKVRLVDGSTKTLELDTTRTVDEICLDIGEKINLKNADEFSLQVLVNDKPEWLTGDKSIPDQVGSLDQIFAHKQRLFFNVDRANEDDPMKLHLVYTQARDDILAGNHPISKEEAVVFAALQCQVQCGDYKPDVHKAGWLSMKDYFPASMGGLKSTYEKPLFDQWKTLVGMSDMNARYRYVQQCRQLKTYGMTVFKVREKVPGKKKLMDALLCFTRDTIIRMEYETKKVIKEYPIKHLMRWAPTGETFTMDFGGWENEYITVVTPQGEEIARLIAGYIDLYLKKAKSVPVAINDDEDEIANVVNAPRIGAPGMVTSSSMGNGDGKDSSAQPVIDLVTAGKNIEKMVNDLFGSVANSQQLSGDPQHAAQQLAQTARGISQLAETIENLAKSPDKTAVNSHTQKLLQEVDNLMKAAKLAYATGGDPDRILLNGVKGIGDKLRDLLSNVKRIQEHPNDPEAKDALERAAQAAQAALKKLIAASQGTYADEPFQALFKEMARMVSAETADMLNTTDKATPMVNDPAKKAQLQAVKNKLAEADRHFLDIADTIAPTAHDADCRDLLDKAGKVVEQNANFLAATSRGTDMDPKSQQRLQDAQKRIAQALADLMGLTEIPSVFDPKEAEAFTKAAQDLLAGTAAIRALDNPAAINAQAADIKNATAALAIAGKAIAAGNADMNTKERLPHYLKNIVDLTKNLLTAVPQATANPKDENAREKVEHAADELAAAVNDLIADTGKQVTLAALYNSAKEAAADTARLVNAAKMGAVKMPETPAKNNLEEAAKNGGEAVKKMIDTLKHNNPNLGGDAPGSKRRTTNFSKKNQDPTFADQLNNEMIKAAEEFAQPSLKLVSTSQTAAGNIIDDERKRELNYSAKEAADAIKRMLKNRQGMKNLKAQMEADQALEAFQRSAKLLEQAIQDADTGHLHHPPQSRDDLLPLLDRALGEVENQMRNVTNAARNAPEDIGAIMKNAGRAAEAMIKVAVALSGTLDKNDMQKALLKSTDGVVDTLGNLMRVAKSSAANTEDPKLQSLLLSCTKAVADALARMMDTSKQVIPKEIEDRLKKQSSDIEDLAEKELRGAANVIERCVARLNAATEAARKAAAEKGIDIDEQNIKGAILEACQMIAKSTGILVANATVVQQETQKQLRGQQPANNNNPNAYRRDPQWAQGLISASRTVAATVQHLVKLANEAVEGQASEEALVVGAQAVSTATTQLVTASTVKGTTPENMARLKDTAGKVNQGTNALVKAAQDATVWEEQQEEKRRDINHATDKKISVLEEMAKRNEIEALLEKKRMELANMRKNQYAQSQNAIAVPASKGGAPTLPKSNSGPPVAKKSAAPPPNNGNSNGGAPAPNPWKAQMTTKK